MTRGRRRLLIGAAVLVAVALGTWWVSGLGGGPLDDAGDRGYLGLRLLLEQRGATVTEIGADDVDTAAARRYDVVFVLASDSVDRTQLAHWHRYVAAGGRLVLGQPDRPAPTGASSEVSGADPADSPDPIDPKRPVVDLQTCTLDRGDSLEPLHHGGVAGHHVYSNERSCYGNGTEALVTSAECRAGVQYTLSDPSLLSNATMGAPVDSRPTVERRGNATLAALLFGGTEQQRVAVVTDGVRTDFGELTPSKDEPSCGDKVDAGAIWQDPNTVDPNGPIDREGVPGTSPDQTLPNRVPSSIPDGSGQGSGSGGTIPSDTRGGSGGSGGTSEGGSDGTERSDGPGGETDGETDGENGTDGDITKPPPSLFDFLSPGVKLALAQLLAVLAWYAWRRSRRRGVVVDDETPVELPSARRVEAVGAMRRRNKEASRAAEDLRARTAEALALDVGLGRDTERGTVADAVADRTGQPRAHVRSLLVDATVNSEAELVTLAGELRHLRRAAGTFVSGTDRS